MKTIISIIGGVLCAVACSIPLLVKNGDFTSIQKNLYSIGLATGSGLILLMQGLDKKNKFWMVFISLSVLLLFYSFVWFFDKLFDFNNETKTYWYGFIVYGATIITFITCLLIKLRQK